MECMTALFAEPLPARPGAAAPRQDKFEATLFIGFGIGNSYIFYVGDEERKATQNGSGVKATEKHWEEVFTGEGGNKLDWWSCKQFENYDKPLGWTVTLDIEKCTAEGFADKRDAFVKSVKLACVRANPEAEVVAENLKVTFFTPGIAVLSVRVCLKRQGLDGLPAVTPLSYDDLKEDPDGMRRNMLAACRDLYNKCLEAAMRRKGEAKGMPPEWTLQSFTAVDKAYWGPAAGAAYPVFFHDAATYEGRTGAILRQAAETDEQRKRQSEEARVSYLGAEVYVDWTESLVRTPDGADAGQADIVRRDIETAFTIGMASWFALYLMNKLASIYLLQTFVEPPPDGEQSKADVKQPTADMIHKKSMAYMDVANAAHPIRWTDRRRDLYLLETIHRNWSSERWWMNIEQRMSLLSLHYKRLEDQRRQEADAQRRELEGNRQELDRRQEANTRRLTHVGTALACCAIISIVADSADLYTKHWRLFFGVLIVAIILVIVVLAYMSPDRETKTESDNGTPPLTPK